MSSSIESFKANPYGAKSLSFSQSTYEKYLAPYVPYAQKPYTYISPYVAKADSLASDGLVKVEDSFPLVKEEPSVIKNTLLDWATYPLKVAQEGKEHVLKTYGSEYQKCGGSSQSSSSSSSSSDSTINNTLAAVVPTIKATVTTSLVLTSDLLAYLSAMVTRTRDSSRDFASAKYHQAQSLANQATRFANDKKTEALSFADQKRSEALTYASEKRDDALQYAHEQGERVKGAAYASGKEAKDVAERKKNQAKTKVDGQKQ